MKPQTPSEIAEENRLTMRIICIVIFAVSVGVTIGHGLLSFLGRHAPAAPYAKVKLK